MLRRVHLWTGLLGLVLFPLTGLYMKLHWPPMPALPGDVRLLYRSRHIYLLLAALVNLLLGLYFEASPSSRRRQVQGLGSGFILVSPFLILWGFAVEPARGLAVPGHLAAWGIYAVFAGSLLHFFAALAARNR